MRLLAGAVFAVFATWAFLAGEDLVTVGFALRFGAGAGFLATAFFAGAGFFLGLIANAAALGRLAATVFLAFLADAALAAFGRTGAILRLALFATVVSIRRKF